MPANRSQSYALSLAFLMEQRQSHFWRYKGFNFSKNVDNLNVFLVTIRVRDLIGNLLVNHDALCICSIEHGSAALKQLGTESYIFISVN